MRKWLLGLIHGIDEQGEEILFGDDDSDSSFFDFIELFSIGLIHISFLISEIFFDRVGNLLIGGLYTDPERIIMIDFGIDGSASPRIVILL